jgi:transposase
MRALVQELLSEYLELEKRKEEYSVKIQSISRANVSCTSLEALPGVGPMTATAFVAYIGNAADYKNGRQAAASLGLVPRQHSSGSRIQLSGITKRGDKYLRSLLVHGARAYVSSLRRKAETNLNSYERKIKGMLEKKHMNVVVVAVANRNARTMLAMLKTGERYNKAA